MTTDLSFLYLNSIAVSMFFNSLMAILVILAENNIFLNRLCGKFKKWLRVASPLFCSLKKDIHKTKILLNLPELSRWIF